MTFGKLFHVQFWAGLLLFFIFLWTGCNSVKHKPATIDPESGLPESFIEFYDKFHSDSLFQMEHITFPLEGMPSSADTVSVREGFYWEKEDWLMHRPVDLSSGNFTRTFKTSFFVIDEIIKDAQGYGTLRRFYTIDDEWHLIYYADMNKIIDSKDDLPSADPGDQ